MSRKIYYRVGLPSWMWERIMAELNFLNRHTYFEKLLTEKWSEEKKKEEATNAIKATAH